MDLNIEDAIMIQTIESGIPGFDELTVSEIIEVEFQKNQPL